MLLYFNFKQLQIWDLFLLTAMLQEQRTSKPIYQLESIILLLINLIVVNGINHSERTSIINLSGSPFTAYDANKVDILGMDWNFIGGQGKQALRPVS